MEYRINGFEQIKSFYSWVFNNQDKVRPTHISLYLFLVNQGNRSNWVEWFKCPYDLAMQGACIGNNATYYKCLDELKDWNLIDYKKGINNYKAPLVKLFVLYKSEQLTEQVTVPLSEQVTEQPTEQQYVQQTVQLPVHIYKLITNNIEQITNNFNRFEKFILKDLKKDNNTFIIPTILEIESYIKENNYNIDAIRFFNFYESKGWMIGKNKMKNWKAAISTWNKATTKNENLDFRNMTRTELINYVKDNNINWMKEGEKEKHAELYKYYLQKL